MIYACNVGEDDLLEGLAGNRYYPLVAERAAAEGAQALPICAKTEEDIADATPEEKLAFLQEMALRPPAWTSSSKPATTCWGSSAF